LEAVIWMRMSSGDALAYSTNTSKVAVLVEDAGVEELVKAFPKE
jgi:hypothetical protein